MDWLEEVRQKVKRRNQILFSKDSDILRELSEMLSAQNRRVVVLWALEGAEKLKDLLAEKYPEDDRPTAAIAAARLWATGKIRMPLAKQDILRCHAMAKDLSSQEDIALCHAIGQACSTIHTVRHALGLPIYELTFLVRHYGLENCRIPVEHRCREYLDRLQFWKETEPHILMEWANFMQKERTHPSC
ncbi:MAG: putative immunity protein [Candidatus Merdivicinus sp.]|jgi:hypothetical protein